jgi:hypothetical protein
MYTITGPGASYYTAGGNPVAAPAGAPTTNPYDPASWGNNPGGQQSFLSGASSAGGSAFNPPVSAPVGAAQTGVQAKANAIGTDPATQALKQMMTGTFSPSDPSYQFRLQQGQQAVERSAAAKGLLGSGNVLQELTQYGQGMASTEYQNQFTRLLSASQNATSQYEGAISGLATMAGLNLQQQGVNNQSSQVGLAASQQATNNMLNTQQQQGIAAGLAGMMNPPSTSASDPFAAAYVPNATGVSLPAYTSASDSAPAGYAASDTTPTGWGAWTSSSGGSGTF